MVPGPDWTALDAGATGALAAANALACDADAIPEAAFVSIGAADIATPAPAMTSVAAAAMLTAVSRPARVSGVRFKRSFNMARTLPSSVDGWAIADAGDQICRCRAASRATASR